MTITHYFDLVPFDLDNLAKPVLDSLKRLVFEDDHQVVQLVVRKVSLASAGHSVHLSEMVAEALLAGREFMHVRVEFLPEDADSSG